LKASRSEIEEAIGELRTRWSKTVLGYHVESDSRRRQLPYVDRWDLALLGPVEYERITLELARAGADTFDAIFRRDVDAKLAEISTILTEALLDREHLIRFESDDLFVPWAMLYVENPAAETLWGEQPSVSLDRFIGLTHLVEHSLPLSESVKDYKLIDSRIRLSSERPIVGLNIDTTVDSMYPNTSCMASIAAFFEERAEVVTRKKKDVLANALRSPAFADTIHFYGCHGAVTTSHDGKDRPYLKLEDQEYIFSGEFRGWLRGRQLRSGPEAYS